MRFILIRGRVQQPFRHHPILNVKFRLVNNLGIRYNVWIQHVCRQRAKCRESCNTSGNRFYAMLDTNVIVQKRQYLGGIFHQTFKKLQVSTVSKMKIVFTQIHLKVSKSVVGGRCLRLTIHSRKLLPCLVKKNIILCAGPQSTPR